MKFSELPQLTRTSSNIIDCELDLFVQRITEEIEEGLVLNIFYQLGLIFLMFLSGYNTDIEIDKKNITVALMGCVVNGPGEAREADIGIAGGDGCAVIFKKDGTQRKIKEEDIVSEILAEIEKL